MHNDAGGFQELRRVLHTSGKKKKVKVEESMSVNWEEVYRTYARTAHPGGFILRPRLVKRYLCIKEKEELPQRPLTGNNE